MACFLSCFIYFFVSCQIRIRVVVSYLELLDLLNKMFLNTLKAPYYDRMIKNFNKDFSDVVSVGDMIENGVKLEKIENT